MQCYITTTRRVYHPACYYDATKPIEAREAAGEIRTVRQAWMRGIPCHLCGGKSAKTKKGVRP